MRINNRVAVATSEFESEVLNRLKYNAMGEYTWLEGLHDGDLNMSTKELVFLAYAASHMPVVNLHPYIDDDGQRRMTVYVEDEEGNMFTPATPSNMETLYFGALMEGRIGKAARLRRLAQRRRLNNIPTLAENNFSVEVVFENGERFTFAYDVVRGTCETKRA